MVEMSGENRLLSLNGQDRGLKFSLTAAVEKLSVGSLAGHGF